MSTGRVITGCAIGAILGLVALVVAFLRAPLALRQQLVVTAFGDTEYASGFDKRKFESIALGASHADVLTALGPPLSEQSVAPVHWVLYADGPAPDFAARGEASGVVSYTCFELDVDGVVSAFHGQLARETGPGSAVIEYDTGRVGRNLLRVDARLFEQLRAERATQAELERRFGPPSAVHRDDTVRRLHYSHSPSSSHFHQRWIGLDRDGRVCSKRAAAYID